MVAVGRAGGGVGIWKQQQRTQVRREVSSLFPWTEKKKNHVKEAREILKLTGTIIAQKYFPQTHKKRP